MRIFWFLTRLATLIAAGMQLALVTPAHADNWTADADDALLLDVRLNQFRLGDGVRGYATPTGVCVDFGDAILSLDIAVRLDKQSRRATGWAYDEAQTITIDRVKNTEQIKNITRTLAYSDIRDTPEGWCVSLAALARWTAVDIRADTTNATLVLHSDKKLPPQLALERRTRASVSNAVFDLSSLPKSSSPYRGIRMPSVDVITNVAVVRDHVSGRRASARYELFASGEVGPGAYDARLSSDDTGLPASLRVRAYRTDPDGRLLGPLRATHVAAGDVQGLATALVAQTGIGRGFVVTNRPVDRPLTFDRTDFHGELPRGWDAELYRNGALIAFANDRADGRYEFTNVALQYGQNRFEIVLYGPQGQIRRSIKAIPVGLASIPPRQTWYWAGADEEGRDLINLVTTQPTTSRGWRGSFGLERGLDARTSVAASLHSLWLPDAQRRNFGEVALRRALGPALAEISAAFDHRGGQAMRSQVLAQLGRTNLNVETIWAGGGFTSDRVTRGVRGLHTVSADHYFGVGRTAVPVHFDARYTQRSGGDDSIELTARSSLNLGRMSLTGELAYRGQRRAFGPDPPPQTEAALLFNSRIGPVRLRGEGRWRLSPDSRFQSATLVGEWSAGDSLLHPAQWRAEFGYDEQLSRAHAGFGYTRRFERFLLSATGEAASDGSIAAGLGLAFSIGADPRRTGGLRVTADKLASQGSALVRLYRDANGNGRRDAGENPEKDVQVTAGRVPVPRLTDANGEVVVDGLETFQAVLIGVDGSSMPDPQVQPSTPGRVVVPRPGNLAIIELPLVAAGDIDGTLVKDGGGVLEGVDLELVDVEGNIRGKARSDFDGFFLFESVPYGKYSVRIAQLVADAVKLEKLLGVTANVASTTPSVHLGTLAARPAMLQAAR